jgi:AraC-like DNA-binding protein
MGKRIMAFDETEYLQRVGFLTCMPELLRRFDVMPSEVLAAAGLSEHALDNPESKIPYRVMGRLLQVAAERTGCPHLGIEIGNSVRTASLGLLGELMRNSPTLRVALNDFALHQHLNAHGGAAYLLEAKRQAFFGYAIYQANVAGAQQIYDGAATAALSLVCELAGKGCVSSLKVLLSRPEPKDLTPYRRSLGLRLLFNAEQTAVVMPLEMLDQPVAGADSRLRLALENHVRALSYAGDLHTVAQLRRRLRVGLLKGRVSAIEMASEFGMSSRTLNRRLNAEGARFQEILDETRLEFVEQLLANTQLSISKIGAIAGYSDPSAFTRSFLRMAGVAPSEWRLNMNSEPSKQLV